jgi:hypothetical protein
MDELVSHSTLAHITNVTIERRHKCHTVDGEEEGHHDCGIGVIQGGIPHGEACPPAGGAHCGGQYPRLEGEGGVLELGLGWPAGEGGGQYPPGCDGGQYPPAGGGGGNVEVCLATGDPPHNITGVGPV